MSSHNHLFQRLMLLVGIMLFPTATVSAGICTEKNQNENPILCHYLEQHARDPEAMAAHIYQHALQNKLLVGHDYDQKDQDDDQEVEQAHHLIQEGMTSKAQRRRLLRKTTTTKSSQLPVVFAHGMGDSCFNSGMQSITKKAGELLGIYAVCIPTGSSQSEDTSNGYFLDMDSSVDVFAAKVQNDPELQNGFHAIGFSQGNNVIRGYIAKYNTGGAVVHSFLSINGVNAGEGAVPNCVPTLRKEISTIKFDMCEFLLEQASNAAYTEFAQKHNFQANYWRDPRPSAFPRYQEFGQLAKWNNEAGFINQTLNDNWAKTSTFVWVLATDDNMVFPREGEHWAAPDPSAPFDRIIPMKETEWYKQDLFGLKTADLAGKNHFESFEGDHLRFTMEDFERWLKTYLVNE